MASVTYSLKKSDKPSSKIYCRFTEGKAIDIKRSIGLQVRFDQWDVKRQCIKNVISVPNRDEINSRLGKLKIFLVDRFNLSIMQGEVITPQWLDVAVKEFFNRPKDEVKLRNLDHRIFLSAFAENWLVEKAPKWKVSATKYMDIATQRHYKILLNLIKKFEGKNRIQLKDITPEVLDDFSNFLKKENYAHVTSARMIGRFKFFCERAEGENLNVNKGYKDRVYVAAEKDDYIHPYLTDEQINKIFNYDFSYSDKLANVADNFVIGLRSGLRISDFLKHLTAKNIVDGFIEIKTQKTNHAVSIPLHWQVQEILNKRKGQLPRKISEQKFNVYIKQIGQVLDFDEPTKGAIVETDPISKRKRKQVGVYPFYKLMTSHICRRSMTTNLYGKIPNSDLMAICGWTNETLLLHYIKKTSRQSAMVLQKHWAETEK